MTALSTATLTTIADAGLAKLKQMLDEARALRRTDVELERSLWARIDVLLDQRNAASVPRQRRG